MARLNNSARWEIGIKSRQDQLSNRHAHDLVSMIVTAVAAALDHAHKQGLLHRDVKPASITLTHVDDEEDRRMLMGIEPATEIGLTCENTESDHAKVRETTRNFLRIRERC